MLISSPHLARSYHHLFPVPPFEEVQQQDLQAAAAAATADSSSSINWYEPGGSTSNSSSSTRQQQQQEGADGAGGGLSGPPYCYGCLRVLAVQEGGGQYHRGVGGTADQGLAQVNLVLRCGQCRQLFCFECDAFIHESLHNCPGCECCAAAGSGVVSGGAANGTTNAAGAAKAAAGGVTT